MTSEELSWGVRMKAAALALPLAVAMPAGPHAASVPAGLFGEWAGKAAEAVPPLGEPGDEVQLSLEADGSGFAVSGSAGSVALPQVTMQPTSRDGVYAPSHGGMLSMFGAGDPPDPLAGERLSWARMGEELVVYTLAIADDGSFALDRYALAREGDGLALRLTRRGAASGEHVLTARLAKAP
jgi:hypothetical protein